MTKFNKDTFKYLSLAKKNTHKREWFTKNEELYRENVKTPMGELLIRIWDKFADRLPGIDISPKKVMRPLRPAHKAVLGQGHIKSESSFFLAEKPTSRFEWNPGIYFQVSAEKDENLVGVGLYMVSSRQMKKMRQAIAENFDEFEKIMKEKKLKSRFGTLAGEVYTRFPKGYDENEKYGKYLKHKNFFLQRTYTQAEVVKPNFQTEVLKDIEACLPFFLWVRDRVGTYSAKSSFKFNDDLLDD